MTTYWNVKLGGETAIAQQIAQAAQLLQQGETVAFPTETVYGLGADATNTKAVEHIFTAKGRPSDNPLIVHIAGTEQLASLVQADCITPDHQKLMAAFWPGPLTIVLPVLAGSLSPLVTAGLNTVGIRIPDHPVALQLLREVNLPIAAPSANSSGRPSPTLASHVRDDLDGRIGGIVDGGATGVGVESTVVQFVDGELFVLRPGGVTAEQMQVILPDICIHTSEPTEVEASQTPRAPGMKYTHYAPKGTMYIVQGEDEQAVAARIQADIDAAKARGESTGVLTFEERVNWYRADLILACGSLAQPDTIARELYAALRTFDERGISYIAAEGVPATGIGQAIMNRLLKAAGHEQIRV
ncbi:L-threonylcarbamoyladenylate synthase [Paenibacillus roseipurpureus]|uniref:Threonylcarbamoyl-AMP synthase n=1 Tax=Paenibacillus roseopurpureus TaxID=2918901 RepID=A0AA96LQ84_9BACL|nr:L-threonylcarbamoyladenylate synthase [Paenibacillus sp. MBLB1832]WNR44621.1 L-threonylcarbamoyladenylate synthase [Paenibacillus sp. MBLB1832]